MSRKTSDVGLDQLLKEVEQEIDARERAQATQPNPSQPNRKQWEQPHTAATLLSEYRRSLYLCQGDQRSEADTEEIWTMCCVPKEGAHQQGVLIPVKMPYRASCQYLFTSLNK